VPASCAPQAARDPCDAARKEEDEQDEKNPKDEERLG
jgi:hypothetical protein